MLYNVEEHLNLSDELGVNFLSAFNIRSMALMKRRDANRYIKSWPLDLP